MHKIVVTPLNGTLPEDFFEIEEALNRTPESAQTIRELFRLQEGRTENILLQGTDPALRLVGIFPNQSDEAFFGYWETENQLPVNQEAFALLETEARRRGHKTLIGPLHFNTFHRYRLRLGSAPSWGRFYREPVNRPYYPELLAELGFEITSRFESRLLKPEAIPVAYSQKAALLAGLAQTPFEFIALTPETWKTYEAPIFELAHLVFSANPAYQPIPKAEFELLYNETFARQLCPHSSALVRDPKTGQLIGLSFCQPDYGASAFTGGRLPDYERDFADLEHKTLLVKTVGVHPGYRRQGLMSYLGAYGMRNFRELYQDVIFCLMRTDNFSRHFTDGLAYERAEYALFKKALV